jgi:hypothetical protein
VTAPELIQTIEAAGGVLSLRGDRIRYEVPEDAALPLLQALRKHREEVIRVLREREPPARCCVHGAEAKWWVRLDGSRVCGHCYPDPFAAAVEETDQICPPSMPEGVRLLAWSPERPPVAIETWAIVNDVPQFIRATLEQLRSAMVGESWLAGNWSVRELVERLAQVGVRIEVVTR